VIDILSVKVSLLLFTSRRTLNVSKVFCTPMPPQNTTASGLNKPFYVPGHIWPRRRFATTVLAGHFDKRPNVVSYPPAPPLEEREQNIDDPASLSESFRDTSIPTRTANEPSSSALPLASGREAVARGTTATSGARASEPSARKPLIRRASTPSIPKAKAPQAKNSEGRMSGAVQALNAPKNKSNLHHVYSSAHVSTPKPIPNAQASANSGKRPAANDSGGDARPAKKARASAPTQPYTTSSSVAKSPEALISPSLPSLSIAMPELTTAGTSIDSSSLSPNALIAGAFSSPSPAPSSVSNLASTTGEGRTGSEGPKRQRVRKGWKGWIEVDPDVLPESPLLIKIDEPVVLSKTRQTRSGRRFADIDGKAVWEDDDEGRLDTPLSP